MHRLATLVGILLALVPAAAGQILVDHTCTEADKIPQTYLDQARNLDIFFVHASVGMGMVNGLKSLEKANATRYTLIRPGTGTPATWFDTNNGLIDNVDWAGMGGNGNPLGKIKGFNELIRNRGYGASADVAFFKFCYIDFGPTTNVAQIWTSCRDTMTSLEVAYPGVKFVWLTTALHALGTLGNKRAEYNQLVRDHCRIHLKPLFDLAALESHDPDGNLALDDFNQETIYAGYTDDNGHLSSSGRERVARALWWLFARIAGWPVGPTAIRTAAGAPVLAAGGAATTGITARLHDTLNAMFIRNASRSITFSLTGPGSLVGTNPVQTSGGTATITYRAGTTVGKATITASATGLSPDQAHIDLILNHAPDAPAGLLCNGKANPTGIPHGHPDLTWTYQDSDSTLGDRQSAYRVILSDDPAHIGQNAGTVWDSGKVLSPTAAANPCGVPLRPGVRYHWKVQTWDLSDAPGGFSGAGTFVLAGGLGYAATGRVDFGTHASLDVHGGNAAGLTIEMWLYRTEQGRATVVLDRFLLDGGGYRVGIDACDHVYFRTRGQKDRRVTAIDAKIRAGQWHHVACQTAGSAGTIFVDGIQRGRNGLINIPNSAPQVRVRLEGAGALMDEVRISDVQRYAGNFTPPGAAFQPDGNTRGLWHFDEGMGPATRDASGNNNTGALDATNWGAGTCPRPGNVPPLIFYTGQAHPGGTVHIKVVGTPSEPVILGISFSLQPLDPPVALPGYGDLYLGWPVVLLPLGTIPPHGLITLSIPLPAALPVPVQFPIQALVGLRLTDHAVVQVK